MAANVKFKTGFTLVELLISLSIMLLLLVLTGVAYQLYTSTWQRDLSKIDQSYQQFRYRDLMTDAIQSLIPLKVTDAGVQAYYFLGREEGFTAVSYSPVFNAEFPAVIRVFRETNEDGSYRLVYEEASLQHTVLKDANQQLPFSFRKVIIPSLSELTFSYFGWESLNAQMSSRSDIEVGLTLMPQWFSDYDGIKRKVHPERILIKMGDFELTVTVPNRSKMNFTFSDEEVY